MSDERWEYPPEKENPIKIQRSWGVPSTRGNALDHLIFFSFSLCFCVTYHLVMQSVEMRCCGVAQEAPNLNLEEEARIKRAVEGKP